MEQSREPRPDSLIYGTWPLAEVASHIAMENGSIHGTVQVNVQVGIKGELIIPFLTNYIKINKFQADF